MRVSVELPDPKTNGLDVALAKQFADIQRQLMGLVKDQAASKQDMHAMMMKEMAGHQEMLVEAMERLMGMVQSVAQSTEPSNALLGALRGLKQVVASLPSDLKGALDQQYQAIQERTVKVSVKPQVTVAIPQGVMTRMDALESALLAGLKRSRSRTFGSNY